jgi:cell division protein FtsI (penicillin-binding protein 3)
MTTKAQIILSVITLIFISCTGKKQQETPIDTTIQKIAENALFGQLEALNADAGIAIVMEVETGITKAVAGKNLAENDTIETASLFKVPCMIVALDDGVVFPDDVFDTGFGIMEYKVITVKDHTADRGGYGKITAEEVIAFSSNVGTAKIILKGYESNPNKFIDGLHQLGFTNIPKNEPVADYLPLVYGIKVPVIEILQFYNSIANGTVKCNPATLEAIKEMLVKVVNAGTGSSAKSDKIQIAGKTGALNDTVLFCGYFPADNPKYSCIVVIANPKNGYPSSGMATSVFKEIAEAIY